MTVVPQPQHELHSTPAQSSRHRAMPWRDVLEVLAIVLLFFIYGGRATPDVNEAHYLGKARHFWDPAYCSTDFFFSSQDAHGVFFFTVGWITQLCSLVTTAWVARFVGWLLLAASWHSLSKCFVPRFGGSLLTAAAWIVLIQQTQMSGEWIIGGIEAKILAYAAVLMAVRQLICQRYTSAWTLFGIASAFHVLVGGWSVIMAGFSLLSLPQGRRPPWQSHVIGLFLGGVISLFSLIPALRLSAGVPADVSHQAAQIYVFQRLSHHLLLRAFPSELVLRHMLVTAAFLWLFGRHRNDVLARRLFGFCAGGTLLLIVGAGLDAALGHRAAGASILRFYWFRSSDIFTPAAVSIGAAYSLRQLWARRPKIAPLLLTAALVLLSINATSVVVNAHRNPIPSADWQGGIRWRSRLRHWQEACDWINRNLPSDALLLTPYNHQTFKWYAHRGEVVSWKDVPQDAAGLIEWQKRLEAVREWRRSPNPQVAERRLGALRAKYGFEYVVTGWPTVRLTEQMIPIYHNAFYAVHRFTDSDVPTVE